MYICRFVWKENRILQPCAIFKNFWQKEKELWIMVFRHWVIGPTTMVSSTRKHCKSWITQKNCKKVKNWICDNFPCRLGKPYLLNTGLIYSFLLLPIVKLPNHCNGLIVMHFDILVLPPLYRLQRLPKE